MTIHPLTSSTSPLHLEYDVDETGVPASSLGAVFGEVTSSSATAAGAASIVPSALSSRAGTLDSRRRIETENDATLDCGINGLLEVGGGIDAMLMSFSQNASPLHPLNGVGDVSGVGSVNVVNHVGVNNVAGSSDEDGGSSSAGAGTVGGFPPLQCPPMMSVRWSSTLERTPLSDAVVGGGGGAAAIVGVESGFLCAADRAPGFSATLDRGGCFTTLERRRFTLENNQGEELGRRGGANRNPTYDTQTINRNTSYDMTLNIPGEESTI